jgi:amino acid transporter
MHYLHQLISLGVYWATVALLFFFAVINLVGIRESAYNALAIFVIHLVTLGIYAVSCILFMINDGGQVLMQNLRTPPVDTDFTAIFCGFAVALLGGP